jgi:hypothetical protein
LILACSVLDMHNFSNAFSALAHRPPDAAERPVRLHVGASLAV